MAEAKQQEQIGLEDEMIESPELLKQLEARQGLREQIDELKQGEDDKPGYNELHKNVKGMLNGMELAPDKLYRCGRFLIKPNRVEEKKVSFTQSASVRWDIEPEE